MLINLFDSRDWNDVDHLNAQHSLISVKSNSNLSYNDILHNLIKNDYVVVMGMIVGYFSEEELSYLNSDDYDYKVNPLNTVINYIVYDIFGAESRDAIKVQAEAGQEQRAIIAIQKIFKIGNLSFIQYNSKAKTTVDILLYIAD